jgi:hypothetical protein
LKPVKIVSFALAFLFTFFYFGAFARTTIYLSSDELTFFNESKWYIKNGIWTEGAHPAEYRDGYLYVSLYDFRAAFGCAVYHNPEENCVYIKFSDCDIWQGIGNNDMYVSGKPYYNPAPYISGENIPMVPLEPCASVQGFKGEFEVSDTYILGQMTLSAPPVPHTISYLELNEAAQIITVFGKNPSGRNVPVKYMLCSTGINKSTPKGTYSIKPIGGEWTYFPKYNCFVMYCSQVVGDVCLHSIPFDIKNLNSLSNTGYAKMGSPASHGCIRLFVEDARYIHENCRGLNINIVDGYINNEEINSIKTKMLSEKLSYEDYVKGLRSVPAS